MANRVTVAFIDQIINVINKNYLAKSGMSLQRGGAYGRKQIYLIDNADYARTGGVEKQLCSGSAGEVYNYLKGMEELGDILFRIAPYRKANRKKGNPITKNPVVFGQNVDIVSGTGKNNDAFPYEITVDGERYLLIQSGSKSWIYDYLIPSLRRQRGGKNRRLLPIGAKQLGINAPLMSGQPHIGLYEKVRLGP